MSRLRRADWCVRGVSMVTARQLIAQHHYTHSASNTAVKRHGLFPKDSLWELDCVGVALWLPPTKAAALATYPQNWRGVLSLSRLVIVPCAPKNACSFLLGRSMRLICRKTWPCLVTYADIAQGHTGAIYRATNWVYAGKTAPTNTWVIGERTVSQKATKTRSKSDMLALGARIAYTSAKHKFIHIVEH